MESLELKIPPVIIFVLSIAIMWVIALATNDSYINGKIRFVFGVTSALISGYILISGIISFKKAKTTFNPIEPDKASSLVCIGIYKHTRNPMYVGLLFGLFTWSCFLNNLFSFLFIFVFQLYMTQFQIKPEERILKSIFDKDYKDYKEQVRRWS